MPTTRQRTRRAVRARSSHTVKKVSWHTTFGAVDVTETEFRHKQTRKLSRPFSHSADVKSHGYSRPLQRVVVDFGADLPFGQVQSKVQEHYGVKLPDSAARTLTTEHAHALVQAQVLPPAPRDTA